MDTIKKMQEQCGKLKLMMTKDQLEIALAESHRRARIEPPARWG